MVREVYGELGSAQHRSQSELDTLHATMSNLSTEHGRILDADEAVDTAHFIQTTLLVEGGNAVLDAVSKEPQKVLELLRDMSEGAGGSCLGGGGRVLRHVVVYGPVPCWSQTGPGGRLPPGPGHTPPPPAPAGHSGGYRAAAESRR
ncbi:flagellin [Streptomyces sp. NPDC017529]|uniref:flagellin n=1 Tax=Streptomyces sp. NPDC017529 TaxID=3365000 RepID=UPI0037AD37AC